MGVVLVKGAGVRGWRGTVWGLYGRKGVGLWWWWDRGCRSNRVEGVG